MAKSKKSRLKANYGFFQFLATLSQSRQKALMKGADREILRALAEVCINLINRNIPLSAKEKAKLRPYAKDIYKLSLRGQSLKKQQAIVQRGGLLGTLLATLVPTILGAVLGNI